MLVVVVGLVVFSCLEVAAISTAPTVWGVASPVEDPCGSPVEVVVDGLGVAHSALLVS